MLVICDGMPRSASTWAFNAVLALLGLCDPGRVTHGGFSNDQLRFFENAPPDVDHIVLKAHSLDRAGRLLCRIGAARAVYTWRHPYDAVASTMRMFNLSFEASLASITQSIELLAFHRREAPATMISYDTIRNQPAIAVTLLAGGLGLTASPQAIAQVIAELSFDRMKNASKEVRALSSGRLISDNGRLFDSQTLLHQDHVLDGSSGYGKELLTPAQQSTIDEVLDRDAFWALVAS